MRADKLSLELRLLLQEVRQRVKEEGGVAAKAVLESLEVKVFGCWETAVQPKCRGGYNYPAYFAHLPSCKKELQAAIMQRIAAGQMPRETLAGDEM